MGIGEAVGVGWGPEEVGRGEHVPLTGTFGPRKSFTLGGSPTREGVGEGEVSVEEGWPRAALTSEPLNTLCFVRRQVPARQSLLQRSSSREQGKPLASPKDSTEAVAPLRVSISWPRVSLPHTGLGLPPCGEGMDHLDSPGSLLRATAGRWQGSARLSSLSFPFMPLMVPWGTKSGCGGAPGPQDAGLAHLALRPGQECFQLCPLCRPILHPAPGPMGGLIPLGPMPRFPPGSARAERKHFPPDTATP